MIIQKMIASLMATATCGGILVTASCGPTTAPGTPKEQPVVSSKPNDLLEQLSAHPDLQILVQTGTQHWAAGEVSLTVRGDGSVEVLQRQASSTKTFHGKLTKAETDELGLLLHQHHFTAPRTSTLPRQPGDTPLLLALRQGGKSLFDADLWEADRDSDPDLEAILRATEQLLYRVSSGALGR